MKIGPHPTCQAAPFHLFLHDTGQVSLSALDAFLKS